MRGQPIAVLTFLVLLVPQAGADPILSATPTDIALSPTETTITFSVDPNGTPLSSFVLNFSASTSGIMLIDIGTSFNPTFDADAGLFGYAGSFGTDQLDPFEVGTIELTGLLPGTPVILSASSNYSDGDFNDIPAGGPTAVALVVPEPTTLALLLAGFGTLALYRLGRRLR